MPTLVIRSPDGTEREQQFEGELTIGRQDGNGLVLTEGGVSRKHARVFTSGAQVLIEDLGSANGTHVDGQQIDGATVITAASKVDLGDYSLALKATPARKSVSGNKPARPAPAMEDPGGPMLTKQIATARKPGAAATARAEKGSLAIVPNKPSGKKLHGPQLRGLTGGWLNQIYPLRGKMVIGRVAPAQVTIEDDSVSRKHAEVEVTHEGVIVRDLGSANGTLLNGQALSGETLLHTGDVIQVGMIELSYESDEPEQLNAPTRRGGGRAAPGEDEAPPSGGKKKLVVIAGAALAILFALGAVAKLQGQKPRPVAAVDNGQPVTVDRSAEKQEYLTQCRSFSSTEYGTDPDWAKAEVACNKALDIDPINEEAIRLSRHIAKEKEAAQHFDEGQKEMLRLREDEALDQFGKIPQDSYYYLKVKPKVVEVAAQAKSRAGDDCKRYFRDKFFTEAYPRCERYMTFACQDMSNEQLYPPLGYKLVLNGRLKKKQWRPKDPMYLTFLTVREKVKPDADRWRCPEVKILRKPPPPTDNRTIIAGELAKKYSDKQMLQAMVDYWNGNSNEALVILEKIRDDMRKAPLHAQADTLRKDIGDVDQLYKTGEGQLQNEDVEKAAIAFQEALQLDQKLLADLALSRPSFYRTGMERDIAHQSFVTGKHWSDRGDAKRSCSFFRIGFGFYKGDTDLNRAVGWCSTQGASAMSAAQTCQDLQGVQELAMDGDGLKDKIAARKQELGCR